MTFILLCDSACALELDGEVVASYTPLAAPPAASGGATTTSSSAAAAAAAAVAAAVASAPIGSLPNASSAVLAASAGTLLSASHTATLTACFLPSATADLGPAAPPLTLAAVASAPLALGPSVPLALRVVLRREIGTSSADPRSEGSEGFLALLWDIGAAAAEGTQAAPGQCGNTAPVPTAAFSWGMEELAGSPTPVWAS